MFFRRIHSSLALVGLLFLLSGCQPEPPTPPTVSGFRCQMEVQYADMTVQGTLTRQSAGLLSFEIAAPETLKDMTLSWNGDTLSVSLYGLSFGVNPQDLPVGGVGQALLNSLDTAIGLSGGTPTADGLQTSGQSASGAFTLLSDPITGYLLSLQVPSIGLCATFSRFEPLLSTPQ